MLEFPHTATAILSRQLAGDIPMPPCQPPRRDPPLYDIQYDHINHRTIIVIPDELLMYHGYKPNRQEVMPRDLFNEIIGATVKNLDEINQPPLLREARKKRAKNIIKRLLCGRRY